MIASALKELGHEVPSRDKLERLMENALDQVKADQGLDPSAVRRAPGEAGSNFLATK